MADLIDREAALELGYWHGKRPDIGNPYGDGVDAVDTADIEALPAADAVEVVRCGECKFQGDEDDCPLLSLSAYTEPDDFCSYGERREENAAD